MITVKDPERVEKSTLKIPNAIGIVSDIRSDVKNDVNQTVEKFSKLNIPVNNAVILSVDEGESIKWIHINVIHHWRWEYDERQKGKS